MLPWLMIIPGLVVVGGWLSAAIHGFLLLGYAKPPHTAMSLLFQGFRFFQADTFRPEGHPIQRRFLISVATFGLGALGLLVLGALSAALGG